MTDTKHICERCKAPALVHITTDDGNGMTVHHFCLKCADEEPLVPRLIDNRVNYAAILIVTGLLVLLISVGADVLAFGSGAGFGWQQWCGIVLGCLLLITGAISRVSTLLVIGLITIIITLLADWLGFGDTSGFGIHQISGTLMGVVMIVAGLMIGRR